LINCVHFLINSYWTLGQTLADARPDAGGRWAFLDKFLLDAFLWTLGQTLAERGADPPPSVDAPPAVDAPATSNLAGLLECF